MRIREVWHISPNFMATKWPQISQLVSGKARTQKASFKTILNVEFSSVKYIHIVVQ
jgi:hypothetical protein